MEHFEYKVIPAPRRGIRAKGTKGPAGRFAGALENVINELAAAGWEYLRAESLPTDERQGLAMRKTEAYQNVLIFRRPAAAPVDTLLLTAYDADQTDDDEADDLFEDINDDFSNDDDDDDDGATDGEDDSHAKNAKKT